MKPAEYLDRAIVGDRVRVTFDDGESYVGFVDVRDRSVFVGIGVGDGGLMLSSPAHGINRCVTDIERLPLGVPAEVDKARAELDRARRLESRPGTSEHAGPHVIQKSYRGRS